ncbi:caspase recruitment domain-containing protein 11-like isoform X3 [Mercenaria mercenaria]|uniref:caspase recruitment domain-containing protein 11-like isoform X3 n=1 Tax=Mercenaria mercenaria TaxID=6596 RepID=UPI00234EF6F0|nr:caspase recruitment domain-containing protein 11-like isoform X3 [Mercenaria mercenaria]
MSDVDDNYQDTLQKNFYLFSRYIVAEDFLEKLISEDVLTIDDKEVITNKCIHHNRRERANKLIEILMTRGERGYFKFLEILEYQYPHVYQDVTKKEPRDPPPGFQRNRVSDRLRIIRNLPNLLEQMKAQVIENSELDSQLCVLQQLLEVSKEENAALERECEMLKNIRQENRQLMLRMKVLETENYEHQVTINTWTTKSYHLMESLNEYKEKCNNLQVKYDNLYKEYTELKREKNMASADTGKVEVPVKEGPRTSPPHVDNGPHYRARLDILEQELDNYKIQCEDLTTRMQRANESVQALEQDNDQLNKELRVNAKERKNLDKQYTDAIIKNESYYQTIQKKNDEIIELQQRSMAEQQRLTELVREKKELFEQNHRLEAELQSCRAEVDKIKARFSGSSYETTGSSQEPGSSGSDAEQSEDLLDFDIGLQCQYLRQRRKVVKKCYSGDKYAQRLAMQRQHGPGADILGFLSRMKGDGTSDLTHKANTLPAKANDSPEKLFQREVAHFRYTRKGESSLSDSMNVNTGSFKDRDSKTETGLPVLWNERSEMDTGSKREPVSHPVDQYDEEEPDTASESTVYIPRTSRGSQDKPGHQKSTKKPDHHALSSSSTSDSSGSAKTEVKYKGGLPTGGKRVYRRDNNNSLRQHGAKCASIISQSDSSSDGNVISDFSSHEVFTELLPKDCLVINRPGWTDKNMSRRVRMKYSNLLDKLEFKGGNHTGIFLTKQYKLLELNEGEQIKGIIFTPNERVNPVITDLKGCCLEDFHRLLCGDFINKKKEREICLEVRNSKQEYTSACEWMENNNGHGDYFFVRCNVNLDSKRDDNVNLKPGDIFLVKNSCYGDEQWQGHVINAATGVMTTTQSLIPNMQQAMRSLACVRCNSTEEEESGKRRGFKVRGQAYDRVLPMKASTKLPVYIIGPDSQVVSAMLDLISANLSHKFIVDTNNADTGCVADAGGEMELYRHDMHIVRGGRLDHMKSHRSIHRVTVLITITAEMSSADTKKLFGTDCDVECKSSTISQCETVKQKLSDFGHSFEEICIPSVHTKEALLRSFKACIETAQNRILWFSSKEMDEQVANRYPSYLGQLCDLSKTLAELSKQKSEQQ